MKKNNSDTITVNSITIIFAENFKPLDKLLADIHVRVNAKIYIKDPESSELGRKIIQNSILLIDEIGFDNFTFKKLGERIRSNESSIYRYFDSKHKLLAYLSSWYWGWIEYKLVFATANVSDPVEKLKNAIRIVTDSVEDDATTKYIDEKLLNRIVVSEFSKTIYRKEIDESNREGFFLLYKRVINRIIELIAEVNPNYPYGKSLVSTIVEGSLHQQFLKDHLKTITNIGQEISATEFYTHLALKAISG